VREWASFKHKTGMDAFSSEGAKIHFRMLSGSKERIHHCLRWLQQLTITRIDMKKAVQNELYNDHVKGVKSRLLLYFCLRCGEI
jgi:hypothetical protein